jgi:hypothetical protein
LFQKTARGLCDGPFSPDPFGVILAVSKDIRHKLNPATIALARRRGSTNVGFSLLIVGLELSERGSDLRR